MGGEYGRIVWDARKIIIWGEKLLLESYVLDVYFNNILWSVFHFIFCI